MNALCAPHFLTSPNSLSKILTLYGSQLLVLCLFSARFVSHIPFAAGKPGPEEGDELRVLHFLSLLL